MWNLRKQPLHGSSDKRFEVGKKYFFDRIRMIIPKERLKVFIKRRSFQKNPNWKRDLIENAKNQNYIDSKYLFNVFDYHKIKKIFEIELKVFRTQLFCRQRPRWNFFHNFSSYMPKGRFLVSNFVFISCSVKRDERIYALMSSNEESEWERESKRSVLREEKLGHC